MPVPPTSNGAGRHRAHRAMLEVCDRAEYMRGVRSPQRPRPSISWLELDVDSSCCGVCPNAAGGRIAATGDILGDVVGGRHQRQKMADFATALRTIRLRFMPNPPFVDVDAVVRQMFTDQAWTSHALRITGARLCHQPRMTPADTSSTESDARSARSRSMHVWRRITAAIAPPRSRLELEVGL